MHILIVTDQHPDSLGGVQVALRLQRRYLERAGHTVSIAAPALHRAGYTVTAVDRDAYIGLPSLAITRDREYGVSWPGKRSDRVLDEALAERVAAGAPPVDLVHIQGDFWGAMIGLRAARRHDLPVMMTMHNNVEVGTRAVSPLLAPVAFAVLRLWRRLAVGPAPRGAGLARARGAWRYLAALASDAALVTAPSQHFASELIARHVVPQAEVTRGGVDDDLIREVRDRPRAPRTRPKLVWLGRMSSEKRVLEFVEALGMVLARSGEPGGSGEPGVDADVVLHGSGLLLSKVRARVKELGIGDRVRIAGPVSYAGALAAMRDADALVQTSMGFETQGLTPFEAAALGTPTVFCDRSIAEDLGVEPSWLAADGSVEALAAVLRQAIGEVCADPGLRVDPKVSDELLQSVQTDRMIEHYRAVLARCERPGARA